MARMSMFLHEIETFGTVIIWSFPDLVIAFRIKTVKRFQVEIQVTETDYVNGITEMP